MKWFKKWEDCSKEELIENLREAHAYNGDLLYRILRLETILSERNICPKCGVKVSKHSNGKRCKAKGETK